MGAKALRPAQGGSGCPSHLWPTEQVSARAPVRVTPQGGRERQEAAGAPVSARSGSTAHCVPQRGNARDLPTLSFCT